MQQPSFTGLPDVELFHLNARSFLVGSQKADTDSSSLSDFEPSYGAACFEAFPEYFTNVTSHRAKVDGMMRLLATLNLELSPGSPVAVIGCGHGTHDVFLAQLYGLDVSGVDICSEALEVAREKAREANLPIKYYCADVTQNIPLAPSSMRAALSLGSSWGFDPDTQRNQAVFTSIYKILQPGGIFVLDYVNGQKWAILEGQRSHKTVALANGATRTSESVYDIESSTQLTKFTLTWPDRPAKIFYHYTRYYTLEQVLAFLQEAGFAIQRAYGDMQGHPFEPQESLQMVIIATKS